MKRIVIGLLFVALCSTGACADPCAAADPQLKRISLELGHGNTDAAALLMKDIASHSMSCTGVTLARARIAAAKGDTAAAEGLFDEYGKAAPEDPRGYAYFARLLIDEGEYSRADAMSVTALEKGPRDAAALAVRGQLLAMKGDRKSGVEMLMEACQLEPEDAEAQYQLGSIYDRAKLPGDAAVHFKKAASLSPNDARIWDYLALNLEPLGDLAGAAEAYKKALQVNREGAKYDAFVDYNYGRLLMKQGDLAASRIHLDRAVEAIPAMRATWYERARLDLRLKDYQLARKDAETAASLADPDGLIIDLQLYAILEQIYRRLGETELANKYAELGRQTPPPVRGEHH